MNIELSVKNIVIFIGIISAGIGNVFFVGKVFSDFELLKTEIKAIKNSQNILEIKNLILENQFKIKSLRFEIDGSHVDTKSNRKNVQNN